MLNNSNHIADPERIPLELLVPMVQRLDVSVRHAVVLRKVYGFTQQQIADYMKTTPETVAELLEKAVVSLEQEMRTMFRQQPAAPRTLFGIVARLRSLKWLR